MEMIIISPGNSDDDEIVDSSDEEEEYDGDEEQDDDDDLYIMEYENENTIHYRSNEHEETNKENDTNTLPSQRISLDKLTDIFINEISRLTTCEEESDLPKFNSELHCRIKNEQFEHQCPFKSCENGYITENRLVKHLQEIHGDKIEFKCQECAMIFKSKYKLDDHMVDHRKFNVPCQFCRSNFEDNASFNKHIDACMVDHSTKDLKDKLVISNYFIRGNNNKAERHCSVIKTSHEQLQQKYYECHLCRPSKKFHQKGLLTRHIKNYHSGEQSFTCIRCRNRFPTRYQWHRHKFRCSR